MISQLMKAQAIWKVIDKAKKHNWDTEYDREKAKAQQHLETCRDWLDFLSSLSYTSFAHNSAMDDYEVCKIDIIETTKFYESKGIK